MIMINHIINYRGILLHVYWISTFLHCHFFLTEFNYNFTPLHVPKIQQCFCTNALTETIINLFVHLVFVYCYWNRVMCTRHPFTQSTQALRALPVAALSCSFLVPTTFAIMKARKMEGKCTVTATSVRFPWTRKKVSVNKSVAIRRITQLADF